jgi:hypothetical protein
LVTEGRVSRLKEKVATVKVHMEQLKGQTSGAAFLHGVAARSQGVLDASGHRRGWEIPLNLARCE